MCCILADGCWYMTMNVATGVLCEGREGDTEQEACFAACTVQQHLSAAAA